MKRLSIISFIFVGLIIFITANSNYLLSERSERIGINIGDIAPDILLNKPDSAALALSSLKGNIVLIDFWASWCGPCRRGNPSKVEVYNAYKDKKFKNAQGFHIYSVSLDRNYHSWVGAIESDNLYWTNHVSDLKAWSSQAAALYRVNSIPANFLINENGVIIAKNLRGAPLNEKLNELLE